MVLTQKILSEMFGTFAMIFVGGGSILLAEKYPQSIFPLLIPVIWGLVIAIMIFLVGHISGAHFNPAVSLAFVLAKRLPASLLWIYWGSQFCGGVMAILILEGLKK